MAAALLDGIGMTMIIPVLTRVVDGDGLGAFSVPLPPLFSSLDTGALLVLCGSVLAVTIAVRELFYLWKEAFSARFGMELRNHWRRRLTDALLFAEEGRLQEDRGGALVDLLVHQTLAAGKFIQFSLMLVVDCLFIAVLLFLSFVVSPLLTMLLGGLFALVVGATYLPAKKHAHALGRAAMKVAMKISAAIGEALAGVRELKIYSAERQTAERIDELGKEQAVLLVRERLFARLPFTMGNLLLAVLVFAGLTYAAGLPAAELQKLLPSAALFVILGQRLNDQVAAAMARWMSARSLLPALQVVMRTIHEASSLAISGGALPAPHAVQRVAFEGVAFAHGSNAAVFQDADVSFEKGVVTAVVGPSGSGKSTVADLLLALRQPSSGVVRIDGTDLAQLDWTSWRNRCAYVSQRPFLFGGTILDNIRLGRDGATDGEIVAAAELAHADDFIRNLPRGYHTSVGERGSKLSGGQAQRITIARALLRDPAVVVFDEPTSSLDEASRTYLIESFQALARLGKIVVVMTHDNALIASAQVQYRIQSGSITQGA